MNIFDQQFNSFSFSSSFLWRPSEQPTQTWISHQETFHAQPLDLQQTRKDSEFDSILSGYSTEGEQKTSHLSSAQKFNQKHLSLASAKAKNSSIPQESNQNQQSHSNVISPSCVDYFSKPSKQKPQYSVNSVDTIYSQQLMEQSAQSSNYFPTQQEKFKTEICNNWVEKGKCAYGQKCQFAHGKQELIDKKQVSKKFYKSKLCNTFHSNSTCPYGQRCMFIHEKRTVSQIKSSFFYQRRLNEINKNEVKQSFLRLPFLEQLKEGRE